MNNNVIVALDQGSSGTRVFAVDGSGAVLYKRAETLAPAHPQEGYAQYNAEELLESQIPLAPRWFCGTAAPARRWPRF